MTYLTGQMADDDMPVQSACLFYDNESPLVETKHSGDF